MPPSEIAQRLEFAIAVSREAAKLILSYYLTPELVVDLKRDRSPVTAADRGAEELIRDRICKRFSDDGVFGEEFGEKPGRNGVRWLLDPVDGTKAFIHGVPLFGTLIGLEADGELLAGVCRLPALNEVIFGGQQLVLGGRSVMRYHVGRESRRSIDWRMRWSARRRSTTGLLPANRLTLTESIRSPVRLAVGVIATDTPSSLPAEPT